VARFTLVVRSSLVQRQAGFAACTNTSMAGVMGAFPVIRHEMPKVTLHALIVLRPGFGAPAFTAVCTGSNFASKLSALAFVSDFVAGQALHALLVCCSRPHFFAGLA